MDCPRRTVGSEGECSQECRPTSRGPARCDEISPPCGGMGIEGEEAGAPCSEPVCCHGLARFSADSSSSFSSGRSSCWARDAEVAAADLFPSLHWTQPSLQPFDSDSDCLSFFVDLSSSSGRESYCTTL